MLRLIVVSIHTELEALVLSTDQGDEVISHHYYPQEEPIPPGCHHLLRLLGLEPSYTPRVKIPYQLIKERGRELNSKMSMQLHIVQSVAIVIN